MWENEECPTDWDNCPACGEPIDYCQGHGSIADRWGAAILRAHDGGNHVACKA